MHCFYSKVRLCWLCRLRFFINRFSLNGSIKTKSECLSSFDQNKELLKNIVIKFNYYLFIHVLANEERKKIINFETTNKVKKSKY
jgi:hypothetical protein